MRAESISEHGDGLTGGRIRTLRLTQGYSQKEFARMIGVDVRSVRRWEKGDSTPAMGEPIRRIASQFRVTPGFLLTGEEDDGVR